MNDIELVLREKLAVISHVIKDKYPGEPHLGVLAGLSGLALFQFYYSRFMNDDTFADTGLNILSRCIDKINNKYSLPTYCTGIAGMGWALEHLKEQDLLEVDTDDRLAALDPYLHTVMKDDLTDKNYDFLHGGIGYGYYFLKRYKNTGSNTLKQRYKDYILESVQLLSSFAERNENTVKWGSAGMDSGERRYNLGLSHGIPSIVNYLSRLYVFEDFKNETQEMLRGGVNYILSVQSNDINDLSLFPNWIKEGTDKNKEKSRVAWCYGDLGIGVSLWQASKALNDQILADTALRILQHTAKRHAPENSMVIDAGICHGSYGNAQIFNSMFRETGIPEFKEAALFWINDGLEKAIHKDGYAGYSKWYVSEQEWLPELSLLEGISGIGLSILSYLSTDDTMHWDECLMIS